MLYDISNPSHLKFPKFSLEKHKADQETANSKNRKQEENFKKKKKKNEVLPPKLLNSREGIDRSDRRTPGGLLRLGGWVIEPKGPRVLKRVRLMHYRRRQIGRVKVVVSDDLSFLKFLIFITASSSRVLICNGIRKIFRGCSFDRLFDYHFPFTTCGIERI